MKKHQTRWLLAAMSQAALASSVSHAQTVSVPTLEDTVVTAARIPQDPTLMPQGVVVITAEQIQGAGLRSANEAIRWLGGVIGRIDTAGGRDQSLDLRGFGEAASSNVVYLVDGVRQNEGDSGGVALSWLPVASIERIEIVRGSGSVIYGEGATGGVINVITNKGLAEPGGSAGVSVGSRDTREARLSLQTRSGPWSVQLHADSYESDNHRQNYERREKNALVGTTWADGSTLLSVQLGAQSFNGGLPGGITPLDFSQAPAKSYKLQDRIEGEKQNLQVSAELPLGDWRMALDLSRRLSQSDSSYVLDGYSTKSETRASRAGARAWNNFNSGTTVHRFMLGADVERWTQDRDSGGSGVQQVSDAIYARHEIQFMPQQAKVHAGARRTLANRDLTGSAVGSLSASSTSWDLGAAIRTGVGGETFGRLGTSFRLPNADEFACYPYSGGPACAPVTLLKPQNSRDIEMGYRFTGDSRKWAARYYRSHLTDEIGYDPNLGNTNFAPTRREGVELDGSVKLGSKIDMSAQFAHRRAFFLSGAYAGSRVPMVPNRSFTARLGYRLSEVRQVSMAAQFVSSQRITDDFTNVCSDKIPGYGTINFRFSEKISLWTLAASVNNLTDKNYYNYRTRCSVSLKSVYPEAGRTFLLSAERRF